MIFYFFFGLLNMWCEFDLIKIHFPMFSFAKLTPQKYQTHEYKIQFHYLNFITYKGDFKCD
jgi:hypothetical protein